MGVERKRNGTYQARYVKNGKRVTIGTYKSKSEARRHLAMARGEEIVEYKPEDRVYLGTDPAKVNFAKPISGGYVTIKPTLKQRFTTWLKNLRAS